MNRTNSSFQNFQIENWTLHGLVSELSKAKLKKTTKQTKNHKTSSFKKKWGRYQFGKAWIWWGHFQCSGPRCSACYCCQFGRLLILKTLFRSIHHSVIIFTEIILTTGVDLSLNIGHHYFKEVYFSETCIFAPEMEERDKEGRHQ